MHVLLEDLTNPQQSYEGDIFAEDLRPGRRLSIFGELGCVTSIMTEILQQHEDEYLIVTENSRYLLSVADKTVPEHTAA